MSHGVKWIKFYRVGWDAMVQRPVSEALANQVLVLPGSEPVEIQDEPWDGVPIECRGGFLIGKKTDRPYD